MLRETFLKNYSASFLDDDRRSENELCSLMLFQPFDGLEVEGLFRHFLGEIVSNRKNGCKADNASERWDQGQFIHRYREQHLEGLDFELYLL